MATNDGAVKSNKRLACPYYKHDPRKFRRARTCAGPGFNGIHRLKSVSLIERSTPLGMLTSSGNTSTAYTDIKSIRASDVFMIARVQLVSQNICENLSYVLLSLFNEPMGA